MGRVILKLIAEKYCVRMSTLLYCLKGLILVYHGCSIEGREFLEKESDYKIHSRWAPEQAWTL